VDGLTPATLAGARTVRVTRTDLAVLELTNPQIAGDSIVGAVGSPPARAAVALADVRRLEERRTSAARTGGLTLGIAAGTVLLVGLLGVAILTLAY
jgi:hypothetical protein